MPSNKKLKKTIVKMNSLSDKDKKRLYKALKSDNNDSVLTELFDTKQPSGIHVEPSFSSPHFDMNLNPQDGTNLLEYNPNFSKPPHLVTNVGAKTIIPLSLMSNNLLNSPMSQLSQSSIFVGGKHRPLGGVLIGGFYV